MIDVFTKFKAMAKRQNGHNIKVLRTDKGGDYVSKDFDTLCTKEGIMHEVVPPYTLQQNGTAEIKNMTIMNMVRSMLKGKYLPNELWGESMSTETYISNRCPNRGLEVSHRKNVGLVSPPT